LWIEQLIAESTGKNGTGIVPITGETPARHSDAYGDDRLFVTIGPSKSDGAGFSSTGAPVASIDLPEPEALGAEFVRWEIATAVAGAILGVNPFDEPNVQQAKDATNGLLARFASDGALPVPPASQTLEGGVTLTLTRAAAQGLAGGDAAAFLGLLRARDYLALLAYLGHDATLAAALHRFRMAVRDRTRAATMFGYGPRYLHSTGQLHKGGPNTGVFVLVTSAPRVDVPIPSKPFTFGTLELAQALGDFASLDSAGRRAVRLHLPSPDAGHLRAALDALLAPLGGGPA
jgi:hypothetical protein